MICRDSKLVEIKINYPEHTNPPITYLLAGLKHFLETTDRFMGSFKMHEKLWRAINLSPHNKNSDFEEELDNSDLFFDDALRDLLKSLKRCGVDVELYVDSVFNEPLPRAWEIDLKRLAKQEYLKIIRNA